MQSFTRDSVLYLVKQWLIELVEEVTGAHSPHNLTNDHAPDIEEQGRILMLDWGKELQTEGNGRVKDSLSEGEAMGIGERYVRPSSSIRTMKKYLKY